MTVDETGTVRLWDDGYLVQAVAIDPETGRSHTVPLPNCQHPMPASGGVCRSCGQQAILDPTDQAVHTERMLADGGMRLLAGAVVTVLFVAVAWLLLMWGWLA